jgi:hypothetical protein
MNRPIHFEIPAEDPERAISLNGGMGRWSTGPFRQGRANLGSMAF